MILRNTIARHGLASTLAATALSCTQFQEAPGGPDSTYTRLECDSLVPEHCLFPYPNNAFTVAADTPTGRVLSLQTDRLPTSYYGQQSSAFHWNRSDGFSTGTPILAQFPGITAIDLELAKAATSVTIERSIDYASPTVLLDTETGLWVPHWVELDETTDDDSKRTLIIRPAVQLDYARRYIVAIRNIPNLEPSEGYVALRDEDPIDDPGIIQRRPLYDDMFRDLRKTGVLRGETQLVWDFTTASRQNVTGWMLHMRDQALELVGPEGPVYEIVSVEENPWPDEDDIAYRIYGEMQVPLYLTQTGPGGLIVFDENDRPTQNPAAPWAKFAFEVLIPESARDEPASLMQYGHGLLGEKEQIESGHFRSFCNEYNYVIFGVDFVGMAADDELYIAGFIDRGRFDDFQTMVFRQHQGMLNSLLAMRMMKGGFSNDPEFGQYVDPDRAYYHGISQGGIFGGTYMGLTTDVERGVLGVMGMPYSLLLTRSVDFDPFFEILRATYPDPRDIQLLLALAQQLWDRTEPNGYARHVIDNPLPGTPTHQVLMRDALGDHQVTTLGAHIMARSMGVRHVDTEQGAIFGLDPAGTPFNGSALVEYDLGLPPDPVGNVPQEECEDPHGKVRKLEEARQQLDLFLQEGVVENFCPSGNCDFHDMSGCDGAD